MNLLKFVDMRMRKFNQTAVPNFLTEEFAQKRKVQSEPMVLTSLFFSERITVPVPVTLDAEIQGLAEAIQPLKKLNATTVDEMKKELAEIKDELAKSRQALLD